MLTITLAYCTDDQTAAQEIAGDVATHVECQHVSVGKANEGPILADLLADVDIPTILLVSDAFLTNPNCMLNAERLFRPEANVLPVFIRGRRYDELADEVISTSTSLENQAEVMHYVNHWQDRYIDLRTQAEELAVSGGEAFQSYLRKIRETSTQAEEVLFALKDTWSLTGEQFVANHYQQLFLFAERPKLWEEFRDYTEAPIDVSGIPGLEMLGNAVTQDDEGLGESVVIDGPPNQEAEGEGAWTQVLGEDGERGREPELEPEEIIEDLAASVVPISGSEAEVLRIEGEQKEHPVVTKAENLSPEQQAASWIERAWTMFDSGDGEAGLELLAAGRDALPEDSALAYNHAMLGASVTGDIAATRRALDAILAAHPEHADALFLAGDLAEADGEYRQARDYWEELSDLEPFYPDLNYRLGALIDDHFPEEYVDAATYLRRATKDDSAPADAFLRYGRLQAGPLDRPQKAVRLLRRATEMAPGLAAAHFALAKVLHGQAAFQAARNAYLTAVHLAEEYRTPENDNQFAETTLADNQPDDHDLLLSLQQKVAALEQQLSATTPAPSTSPAPAAPPRSGEGKTVFISGATSGIGRATAHRLAREGYRLILLGRRAARLEELSAAFAEKFATECHLIVADVRDRTAIQAAVAELPAEWQTIDVLLNNAGKAKGFDPIHTGDYDHWDEMIDVNLKGLLTLTREVSPLMVDRGTGTIINVCSTAGKEVYPNGNVYCATKHAVDALTYAMRLDLVKHGIRVGQICPAHVEETEFAVVRFDGDTERAKIYEDFQPLRSSDVAEAVHFMISQPRHVNIMDVVLQGTQQASSTVVDRSGREKFAPEEE